MNIRIFNLRKQLYEKVMSMSDREFKDWQFELIDRQLETKKLIESMDIDELQSEISKFK